MMVAKITKVLFFLALLNVTVLPTKANEPEWDQPSLIRFDFYPNEIELNSNTKGINVELTVRHPYGISNDYVLIYLKNLNYGNNFHQEIKLEPNLQNESSKNSKTFKGVIPVGDNMPEGAWRVFTELIKANKSNYLNEFIPRPRSFSPDTIKNFIMPETHLLLRRNGELNLNFKTFVGPTHESLVYIHDDAPVKYTTKAPVFRVGETYDVNEYFIKRVNPLKLNIKSLTPTVCKANENKLLFESIGTCNYEVYTEKTKDYLGLRLSQSVDILSARFTPVLIPPKIENQNVDGVPKDVELMPVTTFTGRVVTPNSKSPDICNVINSKIRIYSGGICSLVYETEPTDEYLGSGPVVSTFEIIKNRQDIRFVLPENLDLSLDNFNLDAQTTGGGSITYETISTGICSITGSTLNLLKSGNCAITATQAGSATLAPISATATVMITGSITPTKKSITCVKGKKTKKVSGTNPKCPKGYKVKR